MNLFAKNFYVSLELQFIEKILYFIVVITSFFGPAFFLIDLGPFALFPFRIFVIILWTLFLLRSFLSPNSYLNIKRSKYELAFYLFWVLYAIISLQWALSKTDAIRHIVFLFFGFSLILFSVKYITDISLLKRLYNIWFIAYLTLILIGYWEHLTGNHLSVSGYNHNTLAEDYSYVKIIRVLYCPTGVFRNPNDYATFLVLSIPFSFGFLKYSKNYLIRILSLFSIISSIYFLIITSSRANIIAFLVEISFFLLVISNLKQKVKIFSIVLVMLSVVISLFPEFITTHITNIVYDFSFLSDFFDNNSLGSSGIRRNLIKNCLDFVYRTWGFGVGAGNAEYWITNFSKFNTNGILNPHNWWIEIMTNYGIFIFVGYFFYYFIIFYNIYINRKKSDNKNICMISDALLTSLIGFPIASVSSSSIISMKPQWLLFAFAIALINLRKNNFNLKSNSFCINKIE